MLGGRGEGEAGQWADGGQRWHHAGLREPRTDGRALDATSAYPSSVLLPNLCPQGTHKKTHLATITPKSAPYRNRLVSQSVSKADTSPRGVLPVDTFLQRFFDAIVPPMLDGYNTTLGIYLYMQQFILLLSYPQSKAQES